MNSTKLLESVCRTADLMYEELNRLAGVAKGGGKGPEAFIAAGRISEYANHPACAVECYRQAVQLEPKNCEARARLSIALLKAGQNNEALTHASALCMESPEATFLTLDLTPTSAMTVLADALRANGMQQASETYEKALQVEPNDGYAAGRLAELLVMDGALDRALALRDKIAPTRNFAAIQAALRLAANDPDKLPAILGINRGAFRVAGHV